MSKKKTICFYAMTAILVALIFIVAVFLSVKTFEYIILLILIAGLIYLK
ncbi:alpha/beta hydrolase, partial [Pseudomonas stutzeri]|nr:alpha/beta hydrolase [Stutzerimonas stutzeri]